MALNIFQLDNLSDKLFNQVNNKLLKAAKMLKYYNKRLKREKWLKADQ